MRPKIMIRRSFTKFVSVAEVPEVPDGTDAEAGSRDFYSFLTFVRYISSAARTMVSMSEVTRRKPVTLEPMVVS